MIIDTEQVKYFLENTPMTMYNLSQELGISRTTLSNLKNDPNLILTSKVITIMEIQDYINKGDLIMKLQQDKAREEISEYLNNYEKTRSNEMDEKFNMFKSDVYSIAQEYRKNEAYIYTKKEYQEFIQEQIEEAEDEDIRETFEEEYTEIEERNFNVVVNTINNHNYFI